MWSKRFHDLVQRVGLGQGITFWRGAASQQNADQWCPYPTGETIERERAACGQITQDRTSSRHSHSRIAAHRRPVRLNLMSRGIVLHCVEAAERNGVVGVQAMDGVLHGTWRTAGQRDAGRRVRTTALRPCG